MTNEAKEAFVAYLFFWVTKIDLQDSRIQQSNYTCQLKSPKQLDMIHFEPMS